MIIKNQDYYYRNDGKKIHDSTWAYFMNTIHPHMRSDLMNKESMGHYSSMRVYFSYLLGIRELTNPSVKDEI